MSSQRGSSSSTSSSGGCSCLGSSVRLLMYMRFAAMTMNSDARSMFSILNVLMYSRYCLVTLSMEMS